MAFEFRQLQRPAVRPRVVPAGQLDDTASLVEDVVESFLASGSKGSVRIGGPPGSGKTTALRAIDLKLGDAPNLRLLDDPSADEVLAARDAALVVYATTHKLELDDLARFVLAPWSRDDLIEYLLATRKESCASVMNRLSMPGSGVELCDSPDLWTLVLDTLADHEDLVDVPGAIERILELNVRGEGVLAAARRFCWITVIHGDLERPIDELRSLRETLVTAGLDRALRHRVVRVTLAAESVVESLERKELTIALGRRFDVDLIDRIARLVARSASAKEQLRAIVASSDEQLHPMFASILHAADPDALLAVFDVRTEKRLPLPMLRGAHLPAAKWAGLRATSARFAGANLRGADLSESEIDGVDADGAKLDRASLRNARWTNVVATGVSLVDADLSGALLEKARLQSADLRCARLRDARLCGAALKFSRLDGADFEGADLSRADLTRTQLRQTSFVLANCSGTILTGGYLREARLDGACFSGAHLELCDLERVVFPKAEFTGARLHRALMTSSSMRGASFRNADLSGAGLAEIDWEGADLRDADLSHATFHLGSSRSGLVFHAPPMEGSRTGFYGDEYREREFKSPEVVRKANLCSADLRGAKIDQCDFYLVDLRGALCTPDQREHLRRCGAILGDAEG